MIVKWNHSSWMGRCDGMSLLSLTYGSDVLYVPHSREQVVQFTCIRTSTLFMMLYFI